MRLNSITPKLQTSHFSSYSPSITSGGKYKGVPTNVFNRLIDSIYTLYVLYHICLLTQNQLV